MTAIRVEKRCFRYGPSRPHKSAPAKAFTLLAAFLLTLTATARAETPSKVRIYIDADRTGTKESGVSIERGIRTALGEVGNRLAGREVELVIKDHHGNTRRGKKHLKQCLEDDLALTVFSGLHSPPLLANREFIDEHGILLLNPWAAAGPITRSPSRNNWIFRLSVDDSKAGYVIADYAISMCDGSPDHRWSKTWSEDACTI